MESNPPLGLYLKASTDIAMANCSLTQGDSLNLCVQTYGLIKSFPDNNVREGLAIEFPNLLTSLHNPLALSAEASRDKP